MATIVIVSRFNTFRSMKLYDSSNQTAAIATVRATTASRNVKVSTAERSQWHIFYT